ncbi:MAG: hypothetical protein Q4G69_04470 [Planctomycetia bacterium]|nr:hypothetical protein [Planctomycetia bacterium]
MSKFDPRKIPVRTRIGIITIFFWIGMLAGYCSMWATGKTGVLNVCNRFGLIMLALWLAWPELERLPRWIFFALPFVIVVGVWRPILLIYLLPLLFLFWFLSGKTFWS